MASPAAGSLWLGPIHVSKCLPAALSACFPWRLIGRGTSSMLLRDTGNRNCSVPLLCSSRNWLHFGKAGSGADFWNSSDSGTKVTQKKPIQDKKWKCFYLCWESWTALLQALSSGAMNRCLLSPSCFFFPPSSALKASKQSLAGRRYTMHKAIIWREATEAACMGIPLEDKNEFGVAFHDKCLQGINLIVWIWVCAAPLFLTILSKMDLSLPSLAITGHGCSTSHFCCCSLVVLPSLHPLTVTQLLYLLPGLLQILASGRG